MCRRKICPSCTIIHANRAYCRDCAKQITAITKQDYFALYGIAHEANLGDIKRCSSMSPDNLERSLSALKEHGLIACKGISFFTRYTITDNGLATLATAEQIYRGEGDVNRFLAKIQEAIAEG
jgi:DNA-binding transcriptional ArsR family regulator